MIKANKNSGFTLIEVLISSFILTIGIGTVLVLVTEGLQTIHNTKHSVIAANLAQEGIEVTRGIRDSNWIQDEDFDDFTANDGVSDFATVGDSITGCVEYNTTGEMESPCSDSNIYWSGSNYSHNNTGDSTPYSRTITITLANDGADDFLRVEATVSWDSRSIVVEDHLYNWR